MAIFRCAYISASGPQGESWLRMLEIDLLGISGSLRKGSYNTALLLAASELLAGHDGWDSRPIVYSSRMRTSVV